MAVIKKSEDDNIKPKKTKLCKKKKVLEAINVLKQLNQKFFDEGTKKQPLLDDASDSTVFLSVTMKKIPVKKMRSLIKIALPHSIHTDTTEVCLFTGDLEKRDNKAETEPVTLHYKDLLRKHDVTKVTEVISLRKLRTEYKDFESRRQLVGAYDVFLVDKMIAGVLPRVLGKIFIQNRKLPIQINMKSSNLKEQIDKALCKTEFSLTCRGNSCTFEVARLNMKDKDILKNILASVEVLNERLPGKWNNVFGAYIKTSKSQAIPIYISFGNPNEVILEKTRKRIHFATGELSTRADAVVKVFKDGRVVVKNKKFGEKDDGKFKKQETGAKIEESFSLDEDNQGERSEDDIDVKENLGNETSGPQIKIESSVYGNRSAKKSKHKRSKSNVEMGGNVERNTKSQEIENDVVVESESNVGGNKSAKKSKRKMSKSNIATEDNVERNTISPEIENDVVIKSESNVGENKSAKKSKREMTTSNIETEDNLERNTISQEIENDVDVAKIESNLDGNSSVKKSKRKRSKSNSGREDNVEITTKNQDIENDIEVADIESNVDGNSSAKKSKRKRSKSNVGKEDNVIERNTRKSRLENSGQIICKVRDGSRVENSPKAVVKGNINVDIETEITVSKNIPKRKSQRNKRNSNIQNEEVHGNLANQRSGTKLKTVKSPIKITRDAEKTVNNDDAKVRVNKVNTRSQRRR